MKAIRARPQSHDARLGPFALCLAFERCCLRPGDSKYPGEVLTLEEKCPSFKTRPAWSLKTSTRVTHSSHKRAASGVTSLSLWGVKDLESREAPEAPAPSGESRSARGAHTGLKGAWDSDLLLVICASCRQSHAQDYHHHHHNNYYHPHHPSCISVYTFMHL